MAVAFKAIMGAGAVGSMLIIAVTERVPVKPVLIDVTEDFEERFPFVIVMPKQDREPLAVPALPPAHASAEIKVQKVQSGHNRNLRETCRRSYYYIKGHRHWRCRNENQHR